jgi:hypothetical protein
LTLLTYCKSFLRPKSNSKPLPPSTFPNGIHFFPLLCPKGFYTSNVAFCTSHLYAISIQSISNPSLLKNTVNHASMFSCLSHKILSRRITSQVVCVSPTVSGTYN